MRHTYTLFFAMWLAGLYAQIPTSGLIGGWPFNGNAQDMSGNNNHGTVVGAVLTTDRFGSPNSAYSFNGTSSYIVMNSAGPTGTVSRSVSFWAQTNYSNGITVGYNYGDASSSGGIYQIMFNYSCQGVGFDNSVDYLIRGNGVVNNNQWHHIVAVMNASNSTLNGGLQFYIDRVLQNGITCSSSNLSPINSNAIYPVTIGKSCNSALRYFLGKLDDFYTYNRALTYSEVLQLYNANCAPPAPAAIQGSTYSCAGSTAPVYSVAPVNGATSYSWSVPAGWPSSSIASISAPSAPYTGTIGVSAINSCGQSARTVLSIAINQSLAVGIVVSSSTLCQGEQAVLTATGALTYTWSTGSTATTLTVSPSAFTTYSVVGSIPAGCQSQAIASIYVTSGTPPVISVTSNGVKCAGQQVSLASNGASSYTWHPGGHTGFLLVVNPLSSIVYTVSGLGSNGCMGKTTFTQNVYSLPTLTASSGQPAICKGQWVSIAANGAMNFTWQPGNLKGFIVTVSPSLTTTYTVSGTDVNGCVGSTTLSQLVNDCDALSEGEALTRPVAYPNPFVSELEVLSDGSLLNLKIYNVIGEMVYHEESITASVDLSFLAAGTYLLLFENDRASHVQRVIKTVD